MGLLAGRWPCPGMDAKYVDVDVHRTGPYRVLFGARILGKVDEKTGAGYLKLDARGLKHAEGRVRRQWRWDEISTFKLERYRGRRHVVFTVPGPAGAITLYEASKRNLPDGRLVRIQDIYDTPLEDIAATLNAHRGRALGGGD